MKKMNNKGFSLVELIIVIAIMAILAGALAPALIKYVAKSRRSSDVSNAQTIATGITTALSNEQAASDANDVTSWTSVTSIYDGSGVFSKEVDNNVQGGVASFKIKTNKTADAGTLNKKKVSNGQFVYMLDTSTNNVQIAIEANYGGTTTELEVYPNVSSEFTE